MSTDKPLPTPPQLRRRRREIWVGLFVVAGLAGTLIVLATMTDAALFRSVQRRLLDDEELEDLAVAAEAAKGVITLRGTVPDQETRARAEEIARATPGVVKPPVRRNAWDRERGIASTRSAK